MLRSRSAIAAPCLALLAALGPGAARAADLQVGVTLSATGPAASLGIPTRNTFALLPDRIAGVKVHYTILDDATDPTTAVKNARKLTSENAVDVLLGSNSTPGSLAMLDVAAETGTPMIALAAGKSIIAPVDDKRRWAYKTPQNDDLMADAVVDHMRSKGVKTVAFIGFADAYGEGWWGSFSKVAEAKGLKIAASERYNRTDTSVTGQILKIIAARPDAVLIGASGTPAVLPQKTLVERGYKALVYHTHGVVNPDFLRIGGRDVEGAYLPIGLAVVAKQLPDDHPSKKVALDFFAKYESAYGAGTANTFAAHAWDAYLLLNAAVPAALKKGQPGTKEFREALRAALESVKNLAACHGIYNTSPTDHQGFDERARAMARIENGTWKIVH
ncbi:MAG TPA: ABC transporter substrate-binding protein [Anaeromyxobacter sp.]|nr:ABC transporter substrate-binding protein [Anaeromyxobacter sp.]